jgi:hypothetical protein
MAGEMDLARLIRSMQPVIGSGIYVFVTIAPGQQMPQAVSPVLTFREDEGTTLVLLRDEAEAVGLVGAFPSRMITLNLHSSLEAVGFLAAITTALAAARIGVNAVSAYYHDHLFVPADRAKEALSVLTELAAA